MILSPNMEYFNGLIPQFDDTIESVLRLFSSEDFKDVFRYDVLGERRLITKSLPWTKKVPKVFNSADMDRLIAAMQKYGIQRSSNVTKALNIIFDNNRFNPFLEKIRQWKQEITPSGKFSVHTFFQDFLGVEDNEYSRYCSQLFFKGIIARNTYAADFQYFIVLIGEQGIGKDTTLKKVIPDSDWINGNYQFDSNSKRNVENAKGNILCVLSDFNGFNDEEFAKFKAFISNPMPVERVAYGHQAVKHRLNCIFVATTNNETIVPDAAGNRRYLPLYCNADKRKFNPIFDLDSEVVKELWVQALDIYDGNPTLHPGFVFDNAAVKEREKYFEQEPIDIAIDKLIKDNKLEPNQHYTVLDIFTLIASDLRLTNCNRSISTKIGKALKKHEDLFIKIKYRNQNVYILNSSGN